MPSFAGDLQAILRTNGAAKVKLTITINGKTKQDIALEVAANEKAAAEAKVQREAEARPRTTISISKHMDGMGLSPPLQDPGPS